MTLGGHHGQNRGPGHDRHRLLCCKRSGQGTGRAWPARSSRQPAGPSRWEFGLAFARLLQSPCPIVIPIPPPSQFATGTSPVRLASIRGRGRKDGRALRESTSGHQAAFCLRASSWSQSRLILLMSSRRDWRRSPAMKVRVSDMCFAAADSSHPAVPFPRRRGSR